MKIDGILRKGTIYNTFQDINTNRRSAAMPSTPL